MFDSGAAGVCQGNFVYSMLVSVRGKICMLVIVMSMSVLYCTVLYYCVSGGWNI
jgi:hypothetical protein